nr:MAG TPA: hypothetical protein [Caudoviricetes sp.]
MVTAAYLRFLIDHSKKNSLEDLISYEHTQPNFYQILLLFYS